MLTQLLERGGHTALLFPIGSSWEDSLTMLAPHTDDVVCISALPPFAFAHARSLCQRVRAKLPMVKIVVGIWGFSGDTGRAMERFGSARPDKLFTTLAQTVEQIHRWEMPAAAMDPAAAEFQRDSD
jgi:hypothetical protein